MTEKLSAFIDNELTELEERQVLAELERNEELRAKWERYHLIRAAMRNELKGAASTDVDVAASVSEALSRTPAQRDRRGLAMKIGKAVGGLAIAASVATVAILSLQSPGTSPRDMTAVAPGSVVPVSNGVTPAGSRVATTDDTMNTYLLEHSEFAPTAGVGNMLPYVRTVSDDNKR